ncbi:hypothetical protein CSAL01_09060 [Colletotrichum salicis]|uniref:Uncharacterized protein n=1 Tax=Colletotrichum salicis TaxID=1209931 RepID=A0A135SAD4_9PEZI|nr:hypothetical protein CSAL01_09060 [Colletotrichum salicis]
MYKSIKASYLPTRPLPKGTIAFFFPRDQLPGMDAIIAPYSIPGGDRAETNWPFSPDAMLPRHHLTVKIVFKKDWGLNDRAYRRVKGRGDCVRPFKVGDTAMTELFYTPANLPLTFKVVRVGVDGHWPGTHCSAV